jgi:hypothetical protein
VSTFARRATTAAVSSLVLLAASATPAFADEGMWTYDNPPVALLKQRYGFEPTQKWLDHLRLSSVRFNDGGSGSFVSADGLVLTNHHVALGQLSKVSTAERDYVQGGFLAPTREDEIPSADLEINMLEDDGERDRARAGRPRRRPAATRPSSSPRARPRSRRSRRRPRTAPAATARS